MENLDDEGVAFGGLDDRHDNGIRDTISYVLASIFWRTMKQLTRLGVPSTRRYGIDVSPKSIASSTEIPEMSPVILCLVYRACRDSPPPLRTLEGELAPGGRSSFPPQASAILYLRIPPRQLTYT